jgi:uracil-DNA glycosylase family 4
LCRQPYGFRCPGVRRVVKNGCQHKGPGWERPSPMSDDVRINDALRRMVRQQVESLRGAGVEWLKRPAITSQPPDAGNLAAPHDSPPNNGARQPATNAPLAVGSRSSFSSSLFDQPRPAQAMSIDQKRRELKLLDETAVTRCIRCDMLAGNRTQTVFGVGNPDAELMFVGEAPGAEEDARGEPFVGPAGQLLNRIIEACRLSRSEVYIANVIKCRPPGNRTPLPDEISNCIGYLERQIEIIRPGFICALGAVAAQALLKTGESIGRLRGRFHDYRGIVVACTYHPAYLLRNPAAKKDVWEDMKRLLARMGRPVPA